MDIELLKRLLQTKSLGRGLIVHHALTGSTNDDARAYLDQPATVVIADFQTAGRGSQSRVWESEGEGDLYVSFVHHMPVSSRLQQASFALGLAIAMAVEEAISIYAPYGRGLGRMKHPDAPSIRFKWPNDVWLERKDGSAKKCAGVLIEGSINQEHARLVIGFGVNVNRLEFGALASSATSVHAECLALPALDGRAHADHVSTEQILANVLLHAEEELHWLACGNSAEPNKTSKIRETNSLVEAVERWGLLHHNKNVHIDGVQGVLLGIRADGAARLLTSTGERAMFSGQLVV